jgi:beta-phosphoglucomutase
MHTTIKAFIFDLDGVITEASAEYHFRSWERLANEEGLPFSRQANEQLRGVSREESLRRFLNGRQINPAQRLDWLQRKDDYFIKQLAQMTSKDSRPGIQPFLKEARAQGIKMGIASASRNAYAVLEKLNLLGYFEIVGDATLAVRPKPAPDLFIWVAGYLQAQVQEAIVFEDAESGLQAAQNAGFWTVGIGMDNSPHAHIALTDTGNIEVTTLLNRLKDIQKPG